MSAHLETAHLETAVVDVGTLELSMNYQLVQHISGVISDETLSKFIRRFLLESNATAVRWQAHSLVHHIYRLVCGFLGGGGVEFVRHRALRC